MPFGAPASRSWCLRSQNRGRCAARQEDVRLSIRSRQAGLLVRPTVRTVRWPALGVITSIGVLILYGGKHSVGGIGEIHLYAAGLLLGIWTGFLIADPAAEITAGVPPPLLARRAVRIVVALPLVWAAWGTFTWYAGLGSRTGPLAVAFASQLTVALGLAAVGEHVAGRERGGLLAAAGLFAVFFVVPLALRLTLSFDPAGETWAQLYGRWVAVAGVAFLVLLAASADPARRRPLGNWKLRFARSPPVAGESR